MNTNIARTLFRYAQRDNQFLSRALTNTTPKNAATAEEVPKRILKLREKQKHFGIEDGTPVYLKGGAVDKLLYGLTTGLVFIGLGMSLEVFYKLAVK